MSNIKCIINLINKNLRSKQVNEAFHQMWQLHHFKNRLKYENEEIVVATFTEPDATCGEWRQGVNFINILRSPFKPIFCAKELKT